MRAASEFAPGSKAYARAALAAVLLGVTLLHLRGFPGSFLSDDLTHLLWIARADEQHALGAWLLQRFVESLDNGTFAYRPLAFLSYAADWKLFGTRPGGWHAISLGLHVANSLLVAAVAHRWTGRPWAAALAGATFAAFPCAGEVSYWLVGRFDLLAAGFSLVLLLTLGPSNAPAGRSRHAIRIAALYGALLSKESAMPMPLLATIVAAALVPDDPASPAAGAPMMGRLARRLPIALRELLPVWLAFAAYLAWRTLLFGSPLTVYRDAAPPRGLVDFVQRLAPIVPMLGQQSGIEPSWLWPLAALVLLAGTLLLAWKALGGRDRAILVAVSAAAAVYVLSPALTNAGPTARGEGGRHYYLAWIFVAIGLAIAGGAAAGARRVLLVLVGWLLVAQAGSLAQWQYAATQMRRVIAAVPAFARQVDPDAYAALLLPDRIRVAPFARTAQGSIVMAPVQRPSLVDRVAGMTMADVASWRAAIASNGFARYRDGRPLAPERFLGVFCFDDAARAFVRVAAPDALAERGWERAIVDGVAAQRCLPGTIP